MTITLKGLDKATAAWLREEAAKQGKSVEAVILQLVRTSIKATQNASQLQAYHDLDALAGTWSDEETDNFLKATEDFNRIDKTLWQ